MASKYATMNKVILFTIESYIEKCKEEGTEPTEFHLKLLSSIKGWKTFHMFNVPEAKQVIKIAEEEGLQKILDTPVSFLVFSLELIKQLTEHHNKDGIPKKDRPFLNIAEKKLTGGRALYAVSMLKLKQRDEEQYRETKEIIDQSVITAKHFFDYHLQRLV